MRFINRALDVGLWDVTIRLSIKKCRCQDAIVVSCSRLAGQDITDDSQLVDIDVRGGLEQMLDSWCIHLRAQHLDGGCDAPGASVLTERRWGWGGAKRRLLRCEPGGRQRAGGGGRFQARLMG